MRPRRPKRVPATPASPQRHPMTPTWLTFRFAAVAPPRARARPGHPRGAAAVPQQSLARGRRRIRSRPPLGMEAGPRVLGDGPTAQRAGGRDGIQSARVMRVAGPMVLASDTPEYRRVPLASGIFGRRTGAESDGQRSRCESAFESQVSRRDEADGFPEATPSPRRTIRA
jgi:hypothetical protein